MPVKMSSLLVARADSPPAKTAVTAY